MKSPWTTDDVIREVKAFRESTGTMKVLHLWGIGQHMEWGGVGPEHAEIVLPALMEGLESGESKIRSITCGVLGGYGPVSQPALLRLRHLADNDPEAKVREEAEKAIALISAS